MQRILSHNPFHRVSDQTAVVRRQMRAGPNFLIPIVAGSNGALRIIADKCECQRIDAFHRPDTMRTDANRYGLHTFHYLTLPLDTSKCEQIPLVADCCIYFVDLIVTADFAPYHLFIICFLNICLERRSSK